MRAVAVALLGLAVTFTLTACGGGGGGGSASGTPRSFDREDSEVTVLPGLNGFTATQVVTISNDDGGATQGVVAFDNAAGSIASSPSTGGYRIQVTLQATAPTEQDARAALATIGVEHRDALGGATLYLDNRIVYGQYSGANTTRSATVAAALPPALDYRLYQRMDGGNASSSGLAGAYAQVESIGGTATLSGTWDAAAVNTVGGSVTVSGDIASLQASSVGGTVEVTLPGARDTHADLDTAAGTIDVTVTQGLGIGFDLIAQANTGSASIVVLGTEPVGTQTMTSKHYRSPDYAGSDPQVSVAGTTGSGTVSIHD